MAVIKQKKKLPIKTVNIIFCAAMYISLALFIGILFIISGNYQKIYDSPKIDNAEIDFTGIDLTERDVACTLAGEWEFFYNKWIVTDGCDVERDGLISLPSLWTYKNFGNGALPKNGYASFRLRALNVQPDTDVIVYRYYCNFAYRVFINGELNFRSGELSKNADETVVSGRTDEKHPYRTDGSPLEIVIELSATNSGGFNAAPWLHYNWTGNAYGTHLRYFNYVALGISSAAVAISILTFLFFSYKRDFTEPLLMAALYAHFLSSKDMLYTYSLQITAAMILQLITAVAVFIIFMLHLKRCGVVFKKIPLIITSAAAAVFTILLLVFYGTPLSPVFGLLLLAAGCTYLVPIVFSDKLAAIQRGIYGIMFSFVMSVFCFEMCDELGLFVFGTEFMFSFLLMLIIACFTALWLWKMAKNARSAIRVSELECELSSVKHQALKAQIKPHFVYNSLTAIQARYRDGLKEGDRAIEQFAKHLRLITDSNGDDIIPFDNEVRNVLNYFELENLRANGKLNLYLDLNFTDFSVPVLSLQPLVENAIRHGNLRERQDGYIQLSSGKTDTEITVTVTDNGNGFDPAAVHEGVGIENTRKRFALLGAELKIESEIGNGTKVTVKIPLE